MRLILIINIMDRRWNYLVYENITLLQHMTLYAMTFLKYTKGAKFPKIKGHKFEIKPDIPRFIIIVLGLIVSIGVFSRNIDKGDVFEDKDKKISKAMLSISVILLGIWTPFALLMSLLSLMG